MDLFDIMLNWLKEIDIYNTVYYIKSVKPTPTPGGYISSYSASGLCIYVFSDHIKFDGQQVYATDPEFFEKLERYVKEKYDKTLWQIKTDWKK